MNIILSGQSSPEGVSVLLYGAPGCGKTRFVGELPNPLFIDVEGGSRAIKQKDIPIFLPETYMDIVEIISSMNRGSLDPETKLFKFTFLKQEFNIKVLALDTIDAMSKIILSELLRQKNIESPQWDQWNLVISRTRSVIASFRNLRKKGLHVIGIAHEELEKSDMDSAIRGQPALFGKLSQECAGMFDTLAHMTVKGGKRFLEGQPNGIWAGKDRYDVLIKPEDVTTHDQAVAIWSQFTKHTI